MTGLAEFAAQILAGGIEVVDLTSPLHASTPILQLPPQWRQTQPFQPEEISRYDGRGPSCYLNTTRTPHHLPDDKDLEDWQEQDGELPDSGWVLFRTGWSSRGDDPEKFANADANG